MKRNKLKISGIKQSHISAIIVGVILASLLSVLLTALASNFVLNDHLSEKYIGVLIFMIRTISLLVGALVGAVLFRQKYLKSVAFITAGYLIVLIGTGIVFYDGSFKNFLLGVASVLVGGVMALLILQRPKVKKHKNIKISL